MCRYTAGILLLLACVLVTGCAGLTAEQKQATLAFASAATNLGSAASSELGRMHDETVSMNIGMYRLPDLPAKDRPKDSKGQPKEPVIVTEIKGREYHNLAGAFGGKWYHAFASGPPILRAYGDALTGILNADNTAAVKQSTDSFAAALGAFPGSPISSKLQGAVSSLSSQLTNLALARMKARAIHEIVDQANGLVATVCREVSQQFALAAPGQHQAASFAGRFQATAQDLEASSKTAMDLHPSDRLIRSDALASWSEADGNLQEAMRVFPSVVSESDTCASANSALVKSLNGEAIEVKDIEDFYTGGKQLYSTIKTLSAR